MRLRRVLALFEELNTNEGEPYPFKLAIETAVPGAELAGPAQKRVVVPFATSHRVPSNGYAVVHRKRKLRPELLVDVPKAEHAVRMKQLRAELTEDELYETEEVFDGVVDPSAPDGVQSTRRAAAFFEHSLGQGDELFGEHTDNITQVVIYLNPAPPGQPGAKPAPAMDTGGGTAEKRATAAQASCFSV